MRLVIWHVLAGPVIGLFLGVLARVGDRVADRVGSEGRHRRAEARKRRRELRELVARSRRDYGTGV